MIIYIYKEQTYENEESVVVGHADGLVARRVREEYPQNP